MVDDLRTAVAEFESVHIRHVLMRYPDLRVAAKQLGISLSSLYRKLAEHRIREPEIDVDEPLFVTGHESMGPS